MARQENRSPLHKAWDWWQQIDAARGLWETVRSWGWLVVFLLSYGSAVLSIVVSVVLVATGWIADWGPYVVAPAAIIVATIPNFLMWRAKRVQGPSPFAKTESLVLAEPVDGSAVTSPFVVRGYANVMEGNVIIWNRSTEDEEWRPIGNATAGMGMPGQLFAFDTTVSLPEGEQRLRICADPAMADEPAGDEDCVEVGITVVMGDVGLG